MVLDAYTTEKMNEATENLAKFQEEQKQVKIELVAEVTKGTINQATDYIVTAEDFKDPTPAEKAVRNHPVMGKIVAKQESLYKALMAIEDHNSEQWKTAFTEYATFWNDATMRENLAKFIDDKKTNIAEHRANENAYRDYADKFDVMGSGVDRKTRDEMWERVKLESGKARYLENQIDFIKKLFREENSPLTIKNNLKGRKGICTIDKKSPEVLAWEQKTGLSIVAKEYAPDDIDYKALFNGKTAKMLGNSKYMKSYTIYLLNGELLFDRINKGDNKHSLTKFILKNGKIELWKKRPNSDDWEKNKKELRISQKVSFVNN